MEKPHIQFSVPHMLSLMKAMVGRTMNANTLWRIIIGSVFVATMSIGVFAYFTYTWANNTELPAVLTKKDPNTFSSVDLKKTILLYREKEERYNALLTTAPIAPFYTKGKSTMPSAVSSSTASDIIFEASGTSPKIAL